ncbi:MAG: isoaspartyl peptidase/L-asparaginase family protein [Methylocystaceae bacterium]
MKLLIVHGGTDRHLTPPYLNSLKEAAIQGYQYIDTSLVTAVEKAVNHLEDDSLFNCGYGAVLNRDGEAELDAAIIDGSDRSCGAVTAVKAVKNPVSLARLVMDKTKHHILAGEGAVRFGRENGFAEFDSVAPANREVWQREQAKQSQLVTQGGDTVGCLAIADGFTAAASSTGGTLLKLPGRVGDTGVFGAGIWANQYGAALCTGVGEAFIRCLAAVNALNLVARGASVDNAAREIIQEVGAVGGQGAIVLADIKGNLAVVNNTPELPLGLIIDGKYIEGYTGQRL